MAHLGLRPQAIGVLGGYRAQGRTAATAAAIIDLACKFEQAGAAAILLEAVPPEVSEQVVQRTGLPVIGCGAGPACHGSVVVSHDLLGLTPKAPKFVPVIGKIAATLTELFGAYVEEVASGDYPSAEHIYQMPPEEKAKFAGWSNQER
jgi:3-methyl-2-oxobutanoate hydroxymethyltransferase